MDGALNGLVVLDFSTLLPGPLATQMLADAGAEIIKIERPGTGDELRGYTPPFGPSSAGFAVLNRGKRSVVVDMKTESGCAEVQTLAAGADILVEQFRPGVMSRLGLGYDEVARANPAIIYCSITGYGQTGPRAQRAAHDLNYVGDAGMLDLVGDPDPALPPALIADVGGGAYPALINILMALRQRDATGEGCHLDVAMADNLYPFFYWTWGAAHVAGDWPVRGGDMVTGGSPRYQLYRTRDDRHLAVAALEEKFWQTLCAILELDERWRDDTADPAGTTAELTRLIARRTAAEWTARLDGHDVCTTVVATFAEAMDAARERDDGLLDIRVETPDGSASIPSLPLPLCGPVRSATPGRAYSALDLS